MHNFHGFFKKQSYFEGWYLKHQKDAVSIAFIPAYHIDKAGRQTASIQVILNDSAHNFAYRGEDFSASRVHFYVKIDKNIFSQEGICIDLESKELTVKGVLRYSKFKALSSDIMGPFSCLPFMQCSHGVLSMMHSIQGHLYINGKKYDFNGGTGYIEKDYGNSFPGSYFWTQCSDWSGNQDCSLMAAIADIPFGIFSFLGCIGAIWYHGREYRIATYLGARIIKHSKREIIIKQRNYYLYAKRLEEAGGQNPGKDNNLYAPMYGSMDRIIKENICCTVQYRLLYKKKVIFDFVSDRASFESVWGRN